MQPKCKFVVLLPFGVPQVLKGESSSRKGRACMVAAIAGVPLVATVATVDMVQAGTHLGCWRWPCCRVAGYQVDGPAWVSIGREEGAGCLVDVAGCGWVWVDAAARARRAAAGAGPATGSNHQLSLLLSCSLPIVPLDCPLSRTARVLQWQPHAGQPHAWLTSPSPTGPGTER